MDKTSHMYSLMSAYENSGLDRISFCNQEGLSLAKFGYWRSKWLKRMKEDVQVEGGNFVRFDIAEQTDKSSQSFELHYPNGVWLKLGTMDIGLIKELIKAVV